MATLQIHNSNNLAMIDPEAWASTSRVAPCSRMIKLFPLRICLADGTSQKTGGWALVATWDPPATSKNKCLTTSI